jgi:large subunit ribosomal protein L25
MLTLTVEKRKENGAKAPALRRAGSLPGVVYGAHHTGTPIMLDAKAFEKVYKEAGEATIVSLSGLGSDTPTLIHEVDLDPMTNRPRHVDFYAVTKGEKVEVAIPLEFVGEAPAAKAGANIVKVLHEVEVEADPMNLPPELTVDISTLVNIDDQIRAGDLLLPNGVTLVTGEDEVLVLAQAVEEEAVEEAPADIGAIEVEKKGKEEETEEAA